jgi:E3 ubiquitin-protein ligase UBR1
MSGLSSFIGARLLGTGNRAGTSDRTQTPLEALRFTLETMPGARKHIFTPSTRAEILSALYDSFWGPYAHLFLPNSNSSLPMHALLSEVQFKLKFSGAGGEEPVVPGRPCGHIFMKGQSCFRCK